MARPVGTPGSNFYRSRQEILYIKKIEIICRTTSSNPDELTTFTLNNSHHTVLAGNTGARRSFDNLSSSYYWLHMCNYVYQVLMYLLYYVKTKGTV